jgi:hypothetical protein
MSDSARRIVVDALPSPRRGWLVIRLRVGRVTTFRMALTFFPQSRVSPDLMEFLRLLGFVTSG